MVSLADRQRDERMMVDEARRDRADGYVDRAVVAELSIPRLLGDQLIDAGRAAVGAYYSHNDERLDRSIRWLARLVGGEP